MGPETILIVLVLLCGFYVAWNIGANDVANAMGTSVGSGALTLRNAVILAAIFEFAGAFIVGSNVSKTVRKGIFDPTQLNAAFPENATLILACGMIAALLAAGTWLLIATAMSWPVSTTHSIVGAVVGFGVVALGVDGVAWDKVGFIASGWLVSPVISGVIAYVVFRVILRSVFHQPDPVAAARRVAPRLVLLLMFVMTGMTCYKGLKPLWKRLDKDPTDPSFALFVVLIAIVLGLIGFFITKYSLRNFKKQTGEDDGESTVTAGMAGDDAASTAASAAELQQVEKVFCVLQIFTACLVAFAHGSNDVANAIGPLSAAYQAIDQGVIAAKSTTPIWALLLGGIGIVIGLATWGWRVIKTVGEKITELTPSRGFCAEFAASITILLASVLPFGLPISTTHTLVGAVLGVGLARGIGALNLRTMRDVVAGWIITIPAGAGLSILFYFILKFVFVDSGLFAPLSVGA